MSPLSRLRPARSVPIAIALLLVAACGASQTAITFDEPGAGDATTTLPFDTGVDSSTTSSVPSATADVTAGKWVDITGNLVGLASECGAITYLTARPDRDEVIAGIARQGLWSVSNGEEQWKQLGQGAGSAAIVNRPSSIVFAPDTPATFWESGIYNAGGVYRTRDDGATFEALGSVEHSDSVSVDLADPNHQTLLSGTHEQSKVYRSTDGGQTWQDISGGLPADVGFASFPHVVDAHTYLLGTRSGPAAGVYRTTDSGATWTLVHTGPVSGRPLVAVSDGKLYWLRDDGGLITSADGGATWTDVGSYGPVGGTAGNLIELPDGRLATLGVTNVLVSEDHGAHWRTIGATLPFQAAGLTYSATRQAFYIWKSTCDASAANQPVAAGTIMRLDGAALGS